MTQSLGTFYQGQVISIAMSSPSNATQEEKAALTNNDVYLGIYGSTPTSKMIFTTADNTVVRNVDTNGNVTLACVIPATKTKIMNGLYQIEMLIRKSDNTFTSPCDNILQFQVERRRISEVI